MKDIFLPKKLHWWRKNNLSEDLGQLNSYFKPRSQKLIKEIENILKKMENKQ